MNFHFLTFFRIFLLLISLTTFASADIIPVDTNTNLKSVYLIPVEDSKEVRVTAVFLAGEADRTGPEGLAHYLEHLMFFHADKLRDVPVHGRDGNAWVSGRITTYYNLARVPDVNTDDQDLKDLFTFARKLLTPPQLNRKFMLQEKKVVVREFDYRVSDKPDRRAWLAMAKKLYGVHALARSVIGTPQSIMSFSLQDANTLHDKFYHPANMILIVSGNIRSDQVRTLVEREFGGIEAGPANSQKWRRQPVTDSLHETIEMVDRFVLARGYKCVSLSNWKGSGDRAQDHFTMLVLEKLLNSNLPGGLRKPLKIDRFLASGFSARLNGVIEGQAELWLEVRADEQVPLQTLSEEFRKAIQEFARNGVPEKSLKRIKARMLLETERKKEDRRYASRHIIRALSNGFPVSNLADESERIKAVNKRALDGLLHALANPHFPVCPKKRTFRKLNLPARR